MEYIQSSTNRDEPAVRPLAAGGESRSHAFGVARSPLLPVNPFKVKKVKAG